MSKIILIDDLVDPKIPIVIGCQGSIQFGGVGNKSQGLECKIQASHYDATTNTTNVYSLIPGGDIQQQLESSTGTRNHKLLSLLATKQPQLEMSVELTTNVFDKLPREIIELIGKNLESKPEDAYRFALATKHVSTCMAGIIKTIQPDFFKNLLTDFFQCVQDDNNSNKIELRMFFLTAQNTIAHIYIFFYSQSYSKGVERLYRVKFTSYNIKEDQSSEKDQSMNETFHDIEQIVNYIIDKCLKGQITRGISIGTDGTDLNYDFESIDRLSISLTELRECNPELISQYEESKKKYNVFLEIINRFQTLFIMYDNHLKNQGSISEPEDYKKLKHSYTGKTDDDMGTYHQEVDFIISKLKSLFNKATLSENISQSFITISKEVGKNFKSLYDTYKGYFDQVQNLRENIILHGYDPCKERIREMQKREVQNVAKVTNTSKVSNVAKVVKTKQVSSPWRR
jgi:hypothetical protein